METKKSEEINKKHYILTFGCFDGLHKGHVITLAKMKIKAASILGINIKNIHFIIGYISQKRLMQLKPKERYISDENKRKRELESLGFIDETIVQSGIEDLPSIISKLKKSNKHISLFFQGGDQENKRFLKAFYKAGLDSKTIQQIPRTKCYSDRPMSTSQIYKEYKKYKEENKNGIIVKLNKARTVVNKIALPFFEDYTMLVYLKSKNLLNNDANQAHIIAIPTWKETRSIVDKYDLAISRIQMNKMFKNLIPEPVRMNGKLL